MDLPVLFSEALLAPRSDRERFAAIFFETFGIPAINFSNANSLSLYASGRTTGSTVVVGEGVTSVVSITEGFELIFAALRCNFGGSDMTAFLQNSIAKKGIQLSSNTVRGHKEELAHVNPRNNKTNTPKSFTLPDGKEITCETEFKQCGEILFNPNLVGKDYPGVHNLVNKSISECSQQLRKDLYGNVVLAGSCSLLEGFASRLQEELKALAPQATIKIIAAPERKLSPWIGGSILASLSSFSKLLISKAEYEEAGPTIVNKFF